MDGGTNISNNNNTPPRRERKKWEKDTSLNLYVNEAELSKWTSRKNNDPIIIPKTSSPSTSSPSSSLSFSPSTTINSQSTLVSSPTLSSSTTSTASSSPSLRRSNSKSQLLVKSTSSPKPSRIRPPSPSPSSSSLPHSPSPSVSSPSLLSRSPATPSSSSSSSSPSLKQPARERFKSPMRGRAPTPPRNAESNSNNNNKIEKSIPPPSSKPPSSINSSSTSSTTNTTNNNNNNNPTPTTTSPTITNNNSNNNNTSPPVPKVGDPTDKSRIVNFMCGVIKIFAHLATLPEGSEKQKEVKLAALEKRCKERLPPGLCMTVLDVLNDFRFLNALYDLPDQLEDIKSTTNEFEKKVAQFISIVSAKFGGMDLMKEQAAVLTGNNSKKIQICSCRVALRSALKSGNTVVIGEAIQKSKEVGLDIDTLDLAQNISRCLHPESGISIQDIPKFNTLLQKAITTHLLEEAFVITQIQKLAHIEESLQSVESAALVSAQDGNLAPLRDSLDKASSAGLSANDLAAYRAAYQDLHARLHAVREIVMATKEKHHTKLQRALDQAKALKNIALTIESNEVELGQSRNTTLDASAFIKKMREGDTGVHKMLKEAVQSGSSVLTHLEAVASVRSLLETSVSAEDKNGLEEVVNRGGALGMTREVEAAKSALRAMDRVRIKCHLHTDIRILSIPRDTQFPDLKSKIEQTYAATTPFVMKYRDDVGDLITLASQDDLSNAMLTLETASSAASETPTSSRRGSGTPKLDVFLALPSNSVRSSLEVKERARGPKVHPNTQLAASVQQLYDLLSAERRISTPQVPSSLPNDSPPLPRTRPATSSPLSSVESPPTYPHHPHYDHLIDPDKERNNNVNLTPMPPKTAKSSSRAHKRSKSREPKDKLFVAGKSFAP